MAHRPAFAADLGVDVVTVHADLRPLLEPASAWSGLLTSLDERGAALGQALKTVRYSGWLCLELNPDRVTPAGMVESLQRARRIVASDR